MQALKNRSNSLYVAMALGWMLVLYYCGETEILATLLDCLPLLLIPVIRSTRRLRGFHVTLRSPHELFLMEAQITASRLVSYALIVAVFQIYSAWVLSMYDTSMSWGKYKLQASIFTRMAITYHVAFPMIVLITLLRTPRCKAWVMLMRTYGCKMLALHNIAVNRLGMPREMRL